MPAFADTLADLTKFTCGYAELLVKGVEARQFARLPRYATTPPTTIETNHPAFVFGHLCLYPARALTLLGRDPKPVEPPAAWTDLFKAGAPCKDDPEGRIYPTMEAITSPFFTSYRSMAEILRGVPESTLAAPNPNEQQRARFATIGTVLSFYFQGHMLMHLGQVSAWRRCMGLPSAM